MRFHWQTQREAARIGHRDTGRVGVWYRERCSILAGLRITIVVCHAVGGGECAGAMTGRDIIPRETRAYLYPARVRWKQSTTLDTVDQLRRSCRVYTGHAGHNCCRSKDEHVLQCTTGCRT